MLNNFLIFLIRLYQKSLSPDHGYLKALFPGGYCKFRPTCSEYAIHSLKQHGTFKGSIKAFWRILRCNPWSKGGYDPA